MCFFDSPVGRCEVIRELVLLDETQQECACEHGCGRSEDCPLQGWFAEFSGVADPASLPLAARTSSPASRHVAPPRLAGDVPQELRLEAFVFS